MPSGADATGDTVSVESHDMRFLPNLQVLEVGQPSPSQLAWREAEPFYPDLHPLSARSLRLTSYPLAAVSISVNAVAAVSLSVNAVAAVSLSVLFCSFFQNTYA